MNAQPRKFYFSRGLLIFSIILPAFVFAFSAQTFAADFTVNLTTDQHDASLIDGVCDTNVSTAELDCTLRAAVEQANNFGSNDRILFNLPANSTIVLDDAIGGEIQITDNGALEIVGTGANKLTIDGGAGENRIFYTKDATVNITGVTLTGGNGKGTLFNGNGGAIYVRGGSVTLDRVLIKGNRVFITLSESSPPPAKGGGMVFSGGSIHRIINSTFLDNTANDCGGFSSSDNTLVVVNSTISGNSALQSFGGRILLPSHGGGFCNGNSSTVLRNTTITSNAAYIADGILAGEGTLNFGNTIVADNNGYSLDILCNNTCTSVGGNLIGDSGNISNSGSIQYHPTDKRGVKPMLGWIADNGGPTPTHALLTGSPAIDAGLNDVAVDPAMFDPILSFDQRGAPFRRIADGNGDGSAIVDIGAFERSNARGTRPTSGDFDGDGKADIAVFRRSNGFWYVLNSAGGFSAVQWGLGTDYLVPGDYDGDGKTDVAVYRVGLPTVSITDNAWHIRQSSDGIFLTRQYGLNRGFYGLDLPVPADYDGDGKTDLGLFELSDAIGAPFDFKVWQSSDGARYEKRFGANRDRLVIRDYDGDGKADFATVRIEPSFSNNGIAVWQIPQSSNGATKEVQFGLGTDTLVPRDYDGDGKADIAVYRPSNGTWYRLNSSDGSFFATQFGLPTDKVVPADYDGDGKTDIAVFRPSNGTWYLQQSKDGFAAYVFGLSDDVPVTTIVIKYFSND